ncbi:hypothetical protein Thivi_0955 [Thiocystis violascens DSM 198]|uniref:Uncharacterized protein n=1 Tax=Thiocystis violascens (strain ATCC 17096 / DSM 198 / 6111) TaxID=765911 RepID=I3Y7M2_THIV6|nr:hypothetical protein Thivi_0955 [Thiocystis violascens DSM 198]
MEARQYSVTADYKSAIPGRLARGHCAGEHELGKFQENSYQTQGFKQTG